MPVGKIDPVVNRTSGAYGDIYAATLQVILKIIRIRFWETFDGRHVSQQFSSQGGIGRCKKFDGFQINKEPVLHGSAFLEAAVQIVERNPIFRPAIIDLRGERGY
jgi:hypothetical protein